MYRVILVDDEFYVRKSIQNRVNWANLDCEIAAEADNGVRALELIEALKPDIVLVDIMMPEMDGLELIRRAKELSPYTQFAILSGYDDFLYTKEAIKLKVIDYIKKPVDVEELEKAVREMIRLIDTGSQARQRYSVLVDQANHLTELRIERALNEACAGARASPTLQALLDGDSYSWVLVYTSAAADGSAEPERLKKDLLLRLEQVFPGTCHAAVNEADAREIRILLPAATTEAARQAAETLFWFFNARSGLRPDCQVSLAYSPPAPLDGLYEQYLSALEALKYKLLSGRQGIQHPEQRKAPSQEEVKMVFSLLESIKRSIASRQFNMLDRILDQLFSEKLMTSTRVLEDTLFSLYGFVREYTVRYNVWMPEQYAQKMTGSHALLQYDDLRGVKEAARALLYQFVCEGCPIDDEHVITQVKKYIDENYRERIGLKSIAALFYLNASYLSSLFKRKTGVNLNKYIETARLEQAKTLLTSLDVPVNDVSSMIGYTDPNYFTKAFKKRTGKTPLEYRALSKKL